VKRSGYSKEDSSEIFSPERIGSKNVLYKKEKKEKNKCDALSQKKKK